MSNYRIETITCGVAVYWATQPSRGLANAIRIFATTAEARAWINNV